MTNKDQILKQQLLKNFETLRPVFGNKDYIDLHNKYKRLKKDKLSDFDLKYKLSLFSKALDKYKNSI